MDFNNIIQWVDPGEEKRTRGGRRLVVSRPRYRRFDIKFSYLTDEEAYGVAFEVDRQLGKTGDFYLVLDAEEAGQFKFRRSIYAALIDSSPIVNSDIGIKSWTISAEELI